jgi:hypothetical protein
MSRMQCLDGSPGDTWSLEAQAVREPAPFQHARNPNKDWPFLFSYQEGRVLVNKAPFKSKYEQAEAAGVALF